MWYNTNMSRLNETLGVSGNKSANTEPAGNRVIQIPPAEPSDRLKLTGDCMTLLKKQGDQFDSRTLDTFSNNMIKLLGGVEFGDSQRSNKLIYQDKYRGETEIIFYSDSRGFEYNPGGTRIRIEYGDTVEEIGGEDTLLSLRIRTTTPNRNQSPVEYYSFFANAEGQMPLDDVLEREKEISGEKVQEFCGRALELYQSQQQQQQPQA